VLRRAEGWIYEGWEVAASSTSGWACRFRLLVDEHSVARALEAEADGPYGLRRLSVRRDPKGQWWVNGQRRSDLDACRDVDVAATPLTNTPTIRRLALPPHGSADLTVAWVDIPSLTVAAGEQGYDRLDPIDGAARYRFRSSDTPGLVLTVDPDGLVRDYERFAQRVFRR
jgi:hypothetical protein